MNAKLPISHRFYVNEGTTTRNTLLGFYAQTGSGATQQIGGTVSDMSLMQRSDALPLHKLYAYVSSNSLSDSSETTSHSSSFH